MQPAVTDKAREWQPLGEWRLEVRRGRLKNGRAEIRLEPQTMQLLAVLAAPAGEVHTREELMQAVWGHLHITEDALNRAVSRLRRRLAGTDGALAVETVPKIGYKLSVVAAAEPAPAEAEIPEIPQMREAGAEPDALADMERLTPPSTTHRGWRLGGFGVVAGVGFLLGALGGLPQLSSQESFEHASVRPLTSLEGEEKDPSFSPDGARVAFSWRQSSGEGADIYIRSLQSDELTPLTRDAGDDVFPTWSPDGARIAFERKHGNECGIYLAPADGGEAQFLTYCHPESEGLAWSPDGRWLAYSPATGTPFPTIALLNVVDGQVRALPPLPPGVIADSDPAFSPDGRELAFLRWRGAMVSDIYALDLDSGEQRQITDDRLEIHGFTWTGDDRSILFSTSRGGARAVWRTPVNGGAPTRVTSGNGRVGRIVASPRGNRAVYEEQISRADIWSVPLDGSAPSPLITSTRWTFQPRVSPDGSQIAYASDASGASEIWISRIDGSQPRRLTNFSGPHTGRPAWSPDGRSIVFESVAGGGFDLYTISVQGGTPQRLTKDPSDDLAASWSRDGRHVYFASQRTGTWQLWTYDLDTGEERRITQDGGYYAQESEDGRFLYFSKRADAGLWRMILADGSVTRVYDRIGPQGTSLWALNGDSVVFMTVDRPLTGSLSELDLKTGEVRTIAELPRLFYLSGLAMIDPNHVAFSRMERTETDLMVIEAVSELGEMRTAWSEALEDERGGSPPGAALNLGAARLYP